jgi:hypothetical protein
MCSGMCSCLKNAVFWNVTQLACSVHRLLVTANVVPSSLILFHRDDREAMQEPHGVTSQKTPFFIATAVKTSNLTYIHVSLKRTESPNLLDQKVELPSCKKNVQK